MQRRPCGLTRRESGVCQRARRSSELRRYRKRAVALLSRSEKRNGLGNDRDLVGRFLQDHPNATTANVHPSDMRSLHALFSLQYKGAIRCFPNSASILATTGQAILLNLHLALVFEQDEDSGSRLARRSIVQRAETSDHSN